ncbi:hypothetical protein FA95DRAFT_1503705 [Auriscalpium vulgare]|uniref:Uncharacterized protein n=1 Tax=Auriscalpium vulgare TaxID=40419 RepID=A0ACB8R6L2_9AGAM|nr:hypothetical protein FA95DRAFT_1503705 [Auriscalpium vulgare]
MPIAVTEEMADSICSDLTLAELLKLRATCRWWRKMTDRSLRLRLHKDLLHFVPFPLRLRDTLRLTRSVLSGSFVLRFAMHRTNQGDMDVKDLDIYAPQTSAPGLISHLEKEQGYCILRSRSRDPIEDPEDVELYPPTAIATVVTLMHRVKFTLVDVIIAAGNKPLLPIRHFWSTTVTNYISADRICISHPRLTLNGRGCIAPEHANSLAMEELLEKYRRRGFVLKSFAFNRAKAQEDRCCGYCPHAMRSFGDPLCLTVDFDPCHEAQVMRAFPMTVPYWTYGGWACGARCVAADTASRTIEHPIIG